MAHAPHKRLRGSQWSSEALKPRHILAKPTDIFPRHQQGREEKRCFTFLCWFPPIVRTKEPLPKPGKESAASQGQPGQQRGEAAHCLLCPTATGEGKAARGQCRRDQGLGQ